MYHQLRKEKVFITADNLIEHPTFLIINYSLLLYYFSFLIYKSPPISQNIVKKSISPRETKF
jgi:hypothetical protein